jgi:hypothetical protein
MTLGNKSPFFHFNLMMKKVIHLYLENIKKEVGLELRQKWKFFKVSKKKIIKCLKVRKNSNLMERLFMETKNKLKILKLLQILKENIL